MNKLIIAAIILTFFSCKKNESADKDEILNSKNKKIETKFPDEKMCFLYSYNKDSTKVSFNIDENNNVAGAMFWNPFEKDHALGTLKGKIFNDTIVAEYYYMIEGNMQKEEKIFILKNNKLEELTGPLEEIDGKLIIKNIKQARLRNTLLKVDCSTFKIPEIKQQ